MSILNVLLNLNKIFPEKANFKDVEIVLGKSGHTSSTELFYRNLIYRDFPLGSGEVYVINEKGVVMNLFNDEKGNEWSCNSLVCNIDVHPTLRRLKNIISQITLTSQSTLPDLLNYFDLCSPDLLNYFDLCSANFKSISKKGHPEVCQTSHSPCDSQLLFLRHLSPHFPLVRKLISHIYECQKAYKRCQGQ